MLGEGLVRTSYLQRLYSEQRRECQRTQPINAVGNILTSLYVLWKIKKLCFHFVSQKHLCFYLFYFLQAFYVLAKNYQMLCKIF